MSSPEHRAGRELDALIAGKVMGWKKYLIVLEGTHQPPHYSTDIAAAWQVVEKLSVKCEGFSLIRYETGFWLAYFEGFAQKRADTAPMAICLAALATVGL